MNEKYNHDSLRPVKDLKGAEVYCFSSLTSVILPKIKFILYILCLLLIFLNFFNIAGCRSETKHRQAILIMLDAARTDRFSIFGYERRTTPEIDALAKRGLAFSNHFTQGTYTRSALPALLYSRYFFRSISPNCNRIPLSSPSELFRIPDEESISLPIALSRNGFRTAALSAHAWFTERTRFASQFQEIRDLYSALGCSRGRGSPNAAQVMDEAISWIESKLNEDYFLYLHLMDTHFPHFFDSDAQKFFGAPSYDTLAFNINGIPKDKSKILTGSDLHYINALYDGDLRFADRQVGRLIEFLRNKNRLDKTLIVVTSDHGEHLLEQPGRFEHGGPWLELVARIPLIIFYPPKLKPARIHQMTEAVDVAPTILSILDVDLQEGKKLDGMDLTKLINNPQKQKEYVYMNKGSIRNKRYKCIFKNKNKVLLDDKPPPSDTLKGQLYDLKEDPEEIVNIFYKHPDLLQEFLRVYRNRMIEPFNRYKTAVTHETPRKSFAIAAVDFNTSFSINNTRHLPPPEQWQESQSSRGWLRSSKPRHSWLMGSENAEPVEVSFQMPNGNYQLTVILIGKCTFSIPPEGTKVHLEGKEFCSLSTKELGKLETLVVGNITVKDEMLRLEISPNKNSMFFLIRSLGFKPLGKQKKQLDSDKEKELVERLKTLGYIK